MNPFSSPNNTPPVAHGCIIDLQQEAVFAGGGALFGRITKFAAMVLPTHTHLGKHKKYINTKIRKYEKRMEARSYHLLIELF